MKKLRIGAIILIIYGAIEILGGSAAVFSANGSMPFYTFSWSYLQSNALMVLVIGIILGALKIIAAIGIIKNLMWGMVLGCINCIIMLLLLTFYLPAGITDAILSGTALFFLLLGYFGRKQIVNEGLPSEKED
jgi:drug/metabolite transporter (DMT)-like permease